MQASIFDQLLQSAPWAMRQLRNYLPLMALPPLLCAALAVGWILVTPATWKAYQSLLVRDDLLGENFKPGRFSSLETQKNAQETILHIARKPEVIRGSLEAIGPEKPLPAGTGDWITEQVIEGVKDAISIVAPNGAEFGKTDVVILSVKAGNRERARQLAEVLTGQIEANLRLVRQSQLRSMQAELELAVAQLGLEHETIAQKVKAIELAVGSDLPVLRGLLDRSGGGGDVQRALEQIRLERRAAENEVEVVRKQLQLLQTIESDPSQFAVSSNELLTMQPIFKKLREGLTDAELRLMTESGRYEQDHPTLVHAREVVKQTREQIRREAQSVVQGLQLQLATAEEKYKRLQTSEQQYDTRLARLGEQRVEYEILARELEKRGEALGKAKTELAQIESLAQSADQISLITRIGEPQADIRPQGLSKKSMVLAAIAGGLLLGGGLVGLFYRPDPDSPWLPARTSFSGRDSQAASEPREAATQTPTATSSLPSKQGHVFDANFHDLPHEGDSDIAEQDFPNEPIAPERLAEVNRAWLAEQPEPETLSLVSPIQVPSTAALDFTEPHSGEPPVASTGEPELDESANATPAIVVPAVNLPELPPAPSSNWSQVASAPSPSTHLPSTQSTGHPESLSAGLEPTKQASASPERSTAAAKPAAAAPAASDKIDLNQLKRELAEAAQSARIPEPQARPAAAPPESANPPGRGATDNREGTGQSAETKQPSRQPALTERIEFLSRSISTFCDAIQVEPPREGSV